jgi:hypothetical protein
MWQAGVSCGVAERFSGDGCGDGLGARFVGMVMEGFREFFRGDPLCRYHSAPDVRQSLMERQRRYKVRSSEEIRDDFGWLHTD